MGILIFGELEEYENFLDTFIMLFQSSLGAWPDFAIYDTLHIGKYVGIFFHICVLVMNLILLLNLIIAILSGTFGIFEPLSLALYYDGVIEAIPMYKYSKTYGALIVSFPPVNALVLPFSPLFLVMKDEKKLQLLNRFLTHVCYLPVLFIALTFFLAVAAVLTPLAYLMALLYKFNIIIIDPHRSKSRLFLEFLLFIPFGLPLLLISLFTDTIYFIMHLYQENVTKMSSYDRPMINLQGFVILLKYT